MLIIALEFFLYIHALSTKLKAWLSKTKKSFHVVAEIKWYLWHTVTFLNITKIVFKRLKSVTKFFIKNIDIIYNTFQSIGGAQVLHSKRDRPYDFYDMCMTWNTWKFSTASVLLVIVGFLTSYLHLRTICSHHGSDLLNLVPPEGIVLWYLSAAIGLQWPLICLWWRSGCLTFKQCCSFNSLP